nr:DUF4314 domain-containing protein [uncultured Nitrososphaera sp.]
MGNKYVCCKVGDRVELVFTNDPYTKLKAGDRGTVKSIDFLPESMGGEPQIWIKWDSGSGLALIEGKDSYKVVNEEKSKE